MWVVSFRSIKEIGLRSASVSVLSGGSRKAAREEGEDRDEALVLDVPRIRRRRRKVAR